MPQSSTIWEDTLIRERTVKAKELYDRLEARGWENLSPQEKGVHEALAWLTGDTDTPPAIGD